MDKRIGIEGSPYSKLKQVIGKYGYNRDLTIEVATVIAPFPTIVLELEIDGMELDTDDLIVTQTAFKASPEVGERVLVVGDENSQKYFLLDKVVF